MSIISSSSPQGADIVLTDVDGKTALHWTASNDDDTTIRVLLVGTITSDPYISPLLLRIRLLLLLI